MKVEITHAFSAFRYGKPTLSRVRLGEIVDQQTEPLIAKMAIELGFGKPKRARRPKPAAETKEA